MPSSRFLRRTIAAGTQPHGMTRRGAMLGLLGVTAAAGLSELRVTRAAAQEVDRLSSADWRAFVARFVAADGRVIATGNGGVMHCTPGDSGRARRCRWTTPTTPPTPTC
jgi:hypothetical protein